jgi:hypothetical protein
MKETIYSLFVMLLALLPNLAVAREVSLINLRGGKAYFDGDTHTAPDFQYTNLNEGNDYGLLYEKADLSFVEEVTIDRIDILTEPGAQICYRLGYWKETKEGAPQVTVDRYNGVPGYDVRADSAGVQSIPVTPPITSSFFSIQCFIQNKEFNEDGGAPAPMEIHLFSRGGEMTLAQPTSQVADVKASSTLTPQMVYRVDNLFDGNLETVWAEGDPGYGEGATLTFSFDQSVRISAIWLSNGHQRDSEMFKRNGKLKAFDLGGQTYNAENRPGVQVIPLKQPWEGKEVILKVSAHYPGTKYEDLCLSELGFISGRTVLSIKTEGTRKLVAENDKAIGETQLSKYGVQVGGSWDYQSGLSFNYDPETARFSYFERGFTKNAKKVPSLLFTGVAKVLKTAPDEIVLDLEGYLDRGDFDAYGNVLVRQSRSAEKIKMTITKPSLKSYAECARIMERQGLQDPRTLNLHKKYFGKNPENMNGDDDVAMEECYEFIGQTWYMSPLGFKRSFAYFY